MFAFSKKQRLLKKKDYDDVFKQAKKIVLPAFVVLYKTNNLGYSRLGLALSKKMIAKAYDRNRLKRVIREAFRQKKLASVDIIFLARQGTGKLNKAAIHAALNNIWTKLIDA